MMQQIHGIPLRIKEYQEKRVVTFKDIDAVHERPAGTASRNFRKHRNHFIEGVDFFKITSDEFRHTLDGENQQNEIHTVGTNQPDALCRLGIERPQGGLPESIILITRPVRKP